MLSPQPLRDLLWRPIVIELGRDQPRQLGIASQLAHLQTARPVECRSIGRQRAARITATVASDLPGHPRRGPANTTGDRPRRQARCGPPGNLFTLNQGQMIGPTSPRNRRHPTRLAQIPPDPRSVSPSVRSNSRIESPRHHIAHNKSCCSTLNSTGPTPIPAFTAHHRTSCADELTC